MMFPPTNLTAALLAVLADDDRDVGILDQAWDEYRDFRAFSFGRGRAITEDSAHKFVELMLRLTGEVVTVHNNCATYGLPCVSCGDEADDDGITHNGDNYCESCFYDTFTCCERCEDTIYREDAIIANSDCAYCQHCIDHYFTYCDECDDYFSNDDGHDHGCDCTAPNLKFTFPANGHGTITNDERLTVELPKGTIDEIGMKLIVNLLVKGSPELMWHEAWAIMETVGPQWQGKGGNFTKRLSGAYYKLAKEGGRLPTLPTKLEAGIISEIGNLARAHSSEEVEWHVEFTRDLNLPAEAFAHEDSCWWQGYYESRCALKNWGGIGLRSYDEASGPSDWPSGRAWVQPLTTDSNGDLQPTHDTLGADAYVIYNGYGDMEGYIPARIVAHLTSKTYKKIQLCADPQYVNSSVGYLIADEATCANISEISYGDDAHSTFDASNIAHPNY